MGEPIVETGGAQQQLNPQVFLLFDGVCHLCNSSVQFVLKRDKRNVVHFGALQADVSQKLIASIGYTGSLPDGVVLIDNGKIYFESDAALRVLKYLGGFWSVMSYLRFIPRFVRQVVYRVIAKNRYKWFGKYDTCTIPEKGWRSRFIDQFES
jgi:predicted DCC family thiol-disulfide oxidoreductase YuxK